MAILNPNAKVTKKRHGLLFGCLQAHPGWQGVWAARDRGWINIRRSAGAHKIASFLRKVEDMDVEVLDYWLMMTFDEWKQYIRSRVRPETEFFGISIIFAYKLDRIDQAQSYILWLKEEYPHIPVIIGSKQYTTMSNLPADYYVTGYGEYGLAELLKHIKGAPSNVKIMDWHLPGNNSKYGQGFFDDIKLIDCDRHHKCYPAKDLRVKYEERDFIQSTEQLTLELSRGCHFKCKFCAFNAIGLKGDIDRDFDSYYDELLENYEKWGVTSYSVADETSNDNQHKLEQLGKRSKQLPFKPNLTGFIRCDLMVQRPNEIKLLADMGYWGHYYGLETFNQEAGRTIGKGADPEKLKQGILKAKDIMMSECGRYRATNSMIIGLPKETEDTMWAGIDWWKEHLPEQNMSMHALFIKNVTHENVAASEWEKTWRTNGYFDPIEGTDESFGASKDQLPELLQEFIWGPWNYKNPFALFWQHPTFNWWTANKFYAEVIHQGVLREQGIDNWSLGNFTTPIGDDGVPTYTYDEALELTPTNFDYQRLQHDTLKFQRDYIEKKLAIGQ